MIDPSDQAFPVPASENNCRHPGLSIRTELAARFTAAFLSQDDDGGWFPYEWKSQLDGRSCFLPSADTPYENEIHNWQLIGTPVQRCCRKAIEYADTLITELNREP